MTKISRSNKQKEIHLFLFPFDLPGGNLVDAVVLCPGLMGSRPPQDRVKGTEMNTGEVQVKAQLPTLSFRHNHSPSRVKFSGFL